MVYSLRPWNAGLLPKTDVEILDSTSTIYLGRIMLKRESGDGFHQTQNAMVLDLDGVTNLVPKMAWL